MDNQDEYVRVAYNSSREEIRFIKRQQWIVTNYTVLLYGAIITLSKVLNCPFLYWGIVIVGIAAIILISLLQSSSQKVRACFSRIREKTPKEVENLFFEGKTEQGILDKYCVLGFLYLVVVAGGVLSIFAILKITQNNDF
jgi:hypothetical protein